MAPKLPRVGPRPALGRRSSSSRRFPVAYLTTYYVDQHVAANITFTGGAHSLLVGRKLTHASANITFTGGAHSVLAARSLVEVKANITFTGGSHTLTATHALTTEGQHHLQRWRPHPRCGQEPHPRCGQPDLRWWRPHARRDPRDGHRSGQHHLHWRQPRPDVRAGRAEVMPLGGNAWGIADQLQVFPRRYHYRLVSSAQNVVTQGGSHSMTVDRTPRHRREEEWLALS
jgi:hypothetical protein